MQPLTWQETPAWVSQAAQNLFSALGFLLLLLLLYCFGAVVLFWWHAAYSLCRQSWSCCFSSDLWKINLQKYTVTYYCPEIRPDEIVHSLPEVLGNSPLLPLKSLRHFKNAQVEKSLAKHRKTARAAIY